MTTMANLSEKDFGVGKPPSDPRIEEAKQFEKTEWEPPGGLTITSLAEFGGSTIPLEAALNILVYGNPCFEVDMEQSDWPLTMAKKTRAWKMLCGVAQCSLVKLYGGDSPKLIDPKIFDACEYYLVANKDNAIEKDLKRYSDDAFAAMFKGGPRNQIQCVHVDKQSLVTWLKSQIGHPNLERALRYELSKKGAPLTQGEAEKIASEIGAKENQKEVRAVLKSIQGKHRPGPRGPRKAVE